MKTHFLIARKQVVLDIARGIQKTEERDYSEYYKRKFGDLELPCRLKLRGGYNKEAYYVIVEVDDAAITDYVDDATGDLLYTTYVCYLGKVVETNVENC